MVRGLSVNVATMRSLSPELFMNVGIFKTTVMVIYFGATKLEYRQEKGGGNSFVNPDLYFSFPVVVSIHVE